MKGWKPVSKSRPCKVCGRPNKEHTATWCAYTIDNRVSLCPFVESKKLSKGGYMHFDESVKGGEVQYDSGPQFEKRTNWNRLQEIYSGSMNGELYSHSDSLGVTDESLRLLGVGWDGESLTFPMRNAANEIVGIRRRFPNGEKKAVKGSREGLFIPQCPMRTTVWICEGPTDTAAVLSLGVYAIGRPSCNGGEESLKIITRGFDVLVIADNGAIGIRTAEALAKTLQGRCIIPPKDFKDVREWKRNGLTKAQLVALLQ